MIKHTVYYTITTITTITCPTQSVESHFGHLGSQVRGGDIEVEKRLRKDLKRTKALLADAQIMLDHIKNNAPSKREIAQLKNQVQPQLHKLLTAAVSKTRYPLWLVGKWKDP